ncbi:MAG: DUF1800 family protein, partial [Phycisphaerales bacterium]
MTTACRAALALFTAGGALGWSVVAGRAEAGPPPAVVGAALQRSWESDPANMGLALVRGSETGGPGELRVVHVGVGAAAGFDRVVPVEVDDERVATVVDDLRILAGEKIGYAVVRMIVPGSTTARIGTERVEVVCRAGAADHSAARLRITTPAEGAAVWGTVGVGVSWWRPGTSEGATPRLRVGAAGEQRTIEPVWTNAPVNGPMGLAHFELATDALPEGSARVSVVIDSPKDGEGRTREIAEFVGVRVFRPSATEVLSGECEDEYELPPLPEDRRERKPTIGEDKGASGGKFWNNAGSTPRFRFPVEVPEGRAGWYQVVLTAAGDAAASALPSVGVTIDEANRPRSAAAIAGPKWHRAAIGTPVMLEAGKRVLRLDYLNDFGTRGADRNLRLDRVEVLRVADAVGGAAASAATAGGAGEMAMMAGGVEMMGMMGGGVGGSSGDEAWPASVALRRSPGLRLAFERVLDGTEAAGDVEVRAAAWWPGMREQKRPGNVPRVTLLVNGRAAATQRSLSPRFVVPWSVLRPGENTLQLTGAMPGSAEVRTPVQRVLKPGVGVGDSAAGAGGLSQRFTVHEPGWSTSAMALATGKHRPPEQVSFGVTTGEPIELALPEALEGEYGVEVEARGQNFNGAGVLEVTLIAGAEERIVGVVAPPTNWGTHAVSADEKGRAGAVVSLQRGPKSLRLRLTNPLSEPADGEGKGGGERGVFVQGVALQRRGEGEGVSPVATVLYPPAGAVVRAGGADALVVRVSGSSASASLEATIDGRVVGTRVDVRGRSGPYVVPLSLRGVGAGELRVGVRVTDAAGRTAEAEARTVRAVGSEAPEGTAYERVLIVLERFGYGPDERELASALTMGAEAYLRERLWAGSEDALVASGTDLSLVKYPDSNSSGDVARRAIMQALATPNAPRTRFVMWSQNHFSTWMRKTEPRRKADEHARFTRLGVAPFGEMLMASATSPAMLVYLDQSGSFARRLNENYAREIMELHTLGVHGGYTQEDVTTLARLLTGWTLAREAVGAPAEMSGIDMSPDDYGTADSYRYDPALGEDMPRRFLGRDFPACGPEDRYERTLT